MGRGHTPPCSPPGKQKGTPKSLIDSLDSVPTEVESARRILFDPRVEPREFLPLDVRLVCVATKLQYTRHYIPYGKFRERYMQHAESHIFYEGQGILHSKHLAGDDTTTKISCSVEFPLDSPVRVQVKI